MMSHFVMPQIESVFGIPGRGEGYIVVGSKMSPGETPTITVEMTTRKFEEVFGRERENNTHPKMGVIFIGGI